MRRRGHSNGSPSTAFGHRSEAQAERAHLFAVFRNLVKGRSERRSGSPTPAMWLGLADIRSTWKWVFAQTPPHRLKRAY